MPYLMGIERYREANQPHKERSQQVSRLTAALTYAREGWPVFPLYRKVPPQGSHGFLDATTDAQAIRKAFGRFPGANIGLATGEPSWYFPRIVAHSLCRLEQTLG
jgi:hypothetical protein